jgi:hypothetical protein
MLDIKQNRGIRTYDCGRWNNTPTIYVKFVGKVFFFWHGLQSFQFQIVPNQYLNKFRELRLSLILK